MDKKNGNYYDYRTLRSIINANHDRFSSLNFDDSMSLLQKMNALVEYFKVLLIEYDEWVKYLDDFQDKFDTNLYKTVDDILNEWVASGFFDTLVNKGIIEKFKNEVNERLANQDTKISGKVDKNGNEQITLKNLSKEVLDLFTTDNPEIPINTSMISDGAVTREKLSDSVKQELDNLKNEDSYEQNQINLFNKELKINFHVGGMESDGTLTKNVDSDPVIHSHLIPISLDNNLTLTPLVENVNFAIAYYNSNGFIRRTDYRDTELVNILPENEEGTEFKIRVLVKFSDNRLFYNEDLYLNNNLVRLTQINYKWLEVENNGNDLSYLGKNGTINTAEIGSVNPLEFQENASWRSLVIDTKENDLFYICGVGGNNARLFCFIDSNNKTIMRASNSTTLKTLMIKAPKNSAKLIVNFNRNYTFGIYFNGSVKNKTNIIKESIFNGYNLSNQGEKGGYNIPNVGEKLDFSTANNGQELWRNMILNVSSGDQFYIEGRGGNSPRLWAMLDENDIVLSKCPYSPNLIKTKITIQPNAVKLVLNYQQIGNYYAFRYEENSNKLLKLLIDNDESNSKKFLMVPTPEKNVSAVINGQNMSNELNTDVLYFQKPGDKMVHVSTFKIINDIAYVTYYANTISSGEKPDEHVIRFVYGSINNTERTYVDIQKIGDTVDGKTVTALYDTILMSKDDNELFIMWTAVLDGVYYRLYQTYNIATATYSPIYKNKFKINNSIDDFSVTGMNNLFNKYNISHKSLSGDIGIMQKLSSRVEGDSTYYYSGCYCGPFNCIIKSKDLVIWEFVSQPDFQNDSQWENATYVLNNKVYYFVRQYSDLSPYGFLTTYDLLNGQWSEPIYINDAQSRSDFIYWKNQLYLIHAPNNRNFISIMNVNTQFLEKSYEVQVAMVDDMFYPYVDSYGEQLYMSLTKSRLEIRLAKITLEKYPKETILTKLLNIVKD